MHLELIVYGVHFDGTFKRQGEGDAGSVQAVSIAPLAVFGRPDSRVIAAMRNGSNDLEIIAWDVDKDGQIDRRGTGFAGLGDVFTEEKSNIGVTAFQDAALTAGRNKSGHLEVTSWNVSSDGILTRNSTESAEAVSAVAISGLDEQHITHFATAVCNGQGQLECIAWKLV